MAFFSENYVSGVDLGPARSTNGTELAEFNVEQIITKGEVA